MRFQSNAIRSSREMNVIKKIGMGVTLALAAVVLFGAAGPATAQQQGPAQEITNIKDNIYQYRNRSHNAAFAVTPDGVILIDPINKDAAEWLKAELKSRFNAEVKYLVLSHDHADHSSGGEVFADAAIVVAHEQAKADIIAENRPTAVPNLTYRDTMTIELGGTVAELSFVGRNHSDNMTVVRFPASGVLFAVDFISVNSIGFADFRDAYIPEWIESLKRVEAMDFDILLPGHGRLGDHDSVALHRGYMEDLQSQVAALVRQGKTLEEVQAAVDLTKYKDWRSYERWRDANIAGMYREVSQHRRPNSG